jgi:hypothetical protein
MRSYFARYHAIGDHWLLGGVRQGQTSRFDTREDAQLRLDGTIELNNGHCVGEVVESDKYPEIFSHCPGSIAQAIGGKCFGCGKVVTLADAKEAGERTPMKE